MKRTLIVILTCLAATAAFSSDQDAEKLPVIMDGEFFISLQAVNMMKRDAYLEKMNDRIVRGKGIVDSVAACGGCERKIRIIAQNAEPHGIIIIFYIYTDNETLAGKLKKGDGIEIQGRLRTFTPLNIRRDSFIANLIMEDVPAVK
jgi:hypothetical protein